ncbi:MAG: diaminopimelate epimerase [Euzebyales bacterium]|nr:diaminopimelate epimerase [Euzebyales bacterium]
MEFVKVHGTGNDFVLLPDLADALPLTAELARALCAPHTGLGADGVIRLSAARDTTAADVFMDYRNADGGVAEMCGNGVRCVAKYVLDRGIVNGELVRVATRGGVKEVTVADRHADGRVARVRVGMGAPLPGPTLALQIDDLDGPRTVDVTTLSMGNPHVVLVVPDVAAAPVATWGPALERHEAFPEGTNVEFIAVPSRERVEGRIWERGVGETLASGTGSSAMAVAAHLRGLADRQVTVDLPGGELAIDWSADALFVTGPAVEVAEGRLAPAWLAAVVEEVPV